MSHDGQVISITGDGDVNVTHVGDGVHTQAGEACMKVSPPTKKPVPIRALTVEEFQKCSSSARRSRVIGPYSRLIENLLLDNAALKGRIERDADLIRDLMQAHNDETK